jgi:hypothetical protein
LSNILRNHFVKICLCPGIFPELDHLSAYKTLYRVPHIVSLSKGKLCTPAVQMVQDAERNVLLKWTYRWLMVLSFVCLAYWENLKDMHLCVFTQCTAEIIRVPQVDL